ncbi:hypothetical protein [Kitasatospora purpeofusca]|uniref:hypothetical protein n=1 Tax=Kitasatospora purpeofusca TaxID=67352 RepID=UPI00380778B0
MIRTEPHRPGTPSGARPDAGAALGEGGRATGIAVSRIEAGSAAKRHGVLLLNPGGPGSPGLTVPAEMEPLLPAEVREHFDPVGFDPRGVGRSSPVNCGL